jgi:hypothetical protein
MNLVRDDWQMQIVHVAIFLIILGNAHMNVLFVLEAKVLFLIE